MQADINIREATPNEDSLIAEHFYHLWLDNNVPADSIKPDWLDITLEFIEKARHKLAYKAFVAEVDGKIIASASCQLFAGLYPHILTESYRNYGYIWGVYVYPEYRQQGIAKKLTLLTIEHLKSLGCTRAMLNASPSGKPVYSSLGFCESNTMQLDLI